VLNHHQIILNPPRPKKRKKRERREKKNRERDEERKGIKCQTSQNGNCSNWV
jgi:hypothetical protein